VSGAGACRNCHLCRVTSFPGGDGRSPGAVLSPVDRKYGRVIGQWTDNGISALDAEKARLFYGVKKK
jgi:hypothetical protein